MKTRQTRTKEEQVVELVRQAGILRARDLTAQGIALQHLKRLTDRGEIVRLARGLYALPHAEVTEYHSLAEVAKRVPYGIVCLLSALQFHGLTTQSPWQVWLLLDRRARTPHREYPPVRVVRTTGAALTEGVEEHHIEGVSVRVTNLPKTIADCFKFRNKIGLDIALEALRECLRRDPQTRRPRCSRDDLYYYARLCRVERVMRPYLEAMT